MKNKVVYILEYTPNCEERLIFGVFTSRKLAEVFKDKFDKWVKYDLDIYKYELNKFTNEILRCYLKQK